MYRYCMTIPACVTGYVSVHLDESVVNIGGNIFCFDNVPAGTCITVDAFDSSTSDNANICSDGEFDMINYRQASIRIVFPCLP